MNIIKKFRDWYNAYQFYKNLHHRRNIITHKDGCFLHLWNKGADLESCYREFRQMSYKLIPANTMYNKMMRIFNDQKTGTFFRNSNKQFEPQEYRKADDLVVIEGLIHFSQMHLGLTQGVPDYLALGLSTSDPTDADIALNQEVSGRRLISTEGGSRDLIGMDEHYNMVWPVDIASNNYGESGLFYGKDAESGDKMITHNKYFPVLQHTINENAPGLNLIIQHRSFI